MPGIISNYREFTAGLIGLGVVMTVFLGFAASGWVGDPDPCFRQPNGCYCENINQATPIRSSVRLHPGFVAQPANTWSNLGFILVGLSMLWWTGWERATGGSAVRSNRFTDGSWYAAIFGFIVIFMGPGSMFFHGSLRDWGGFIDSLSMNLFMGFILAYNLVRFFDIGSGWFALIFGGVVTTISVLSAVDNDNSQIYFYCVSGLAFVSQVMIYWRPSVVSAPRGWWWFLAGASVFLTAFIIWRLSWTKGPLCEYDSVAQGHAAWHLLSAGMTFCLWQYFRAQDSAAVIPAWMWSMANIFFGVVVGSAIGGGFGYLLGSQILETSDETAYLLAAVFGIHGAVFSSIAFAHKIYGHGFFAILGYLLDLTWSAINTLAGLIVWIPACLLFGGHLKDSTPESRRSGCFVYDKNPRGSSLDTTIGTVVAGNWSAHEEIHVWQARIFGPVYLITYLLSLLINMMFRLLILRPADFVMMGYRRIVWEDWAYWAGSSSSGNISWGAWFGGFFLALLYLSLIALIPIGIAVDQILLWIAGIIGLVVYSLIRSLVGAQ